MRDTLYNQILNPENINSTLLTPNRNLTEIFINIKLILLHNFTLDRRL